MRTLTAPEKAQVRAHLQRLNEKYGSGGEITGVDYARKVVRIQGGKTPERIFNLTPGRRPGTLRLVFAGQQAIIK